MNTGRQYKNIFHLIAALAIRNQRNVRQWNFLLQSIQWEMVSKVPLSTLTRDELISTWKTLFSLYISRSNTLYIVYPKKYAHGFFFAVLCCGYKLTDFTISIRLTSLALWQSNDCPSASKATLINMDKYFMWIHYERLHNHNKAKHNKTVCIFLGIYCISVWNTDFCKRHGTFFFRSRSECSRSEYGIHRQVNINGTLDNKNNRTTCMNSQNDAITRKLWAV